MSAFLMGERMNLGRRVPRWDSLAWSDPRKWFAVSSRIGLYERTYQHLRAVRDARWKLARLGVDVDSCRRMNLLPPAERGVWDRRLAEILMDEYCCWRPLTTRVTLLLGKRLFRAVPLSALGRRPVSVEYFVPYRDHAQAHTFVVLPHPSGLNRFWNDEDEICVGRDMLAGVIT